MHVGTEIRVRMVRRLNEEKALVEIVETGEKAILKMKGRLRVLKDGTIAVYYDSYNKKRSEVVLGNTGFGRGNISISILEQYNEILYKVYRNPDTITHEEISVLKGMVNRCIKHDQMDWYTTYKFLNYPNYLVMRTYVADAILVRNDLRKDDKSSLKEFLEKYSFLIDSMETHLKEELQLRDVNECETAEGLEQELWERMSIDSWNRIRLAEKIAENAPLYAIMHYIVTAEQEIFNHYIKPFVKEKGRHIEKGCSDVTDLSIERNHEILCGRIYFHLESAIGLGKQIDDESALESSEAIKEFADYLGDKKKLFKEICEVFEMRLGCGLQMVEIKRELEQGNSKAIEKYASDIYEEIQSVLLGAPKFLMKEILENSMRVL